MATWLATPGTQCWHAVPLHVPTLIATLIYTTNGVAIKTRHLYVKMSGGDYMLYLTYTANFFSSEIYETVMINFQQDITKCIRPCSSPYDTRPTGTSCYAIHCSVHIHILHVRIESISILICDKVWYSLTVWK